MKLLMGLCWPTAKHFNIAATASPSNRHLYAPCIPPFPGRCGPARGESHQLQAGRGHTNKSSHDPFTDQARQGKQAGRHKSGPSMAGVQAMDSWALHAVLSLLNKHWQELTGQTLNVQRVAGIRRVLPHSSGCHNVAYRQHGWESSSKQPVQSGTAMYVHHLPKMARAQALRLAHRHAIGDWHMARHTGCNKPGAGCLANLPLRPPGPGMPCWGGGPCIMGPPCWAGPCIICGCWAGIMPLPYCRHQATTKVCSS